MKTLKPKQVLQRLHRGEGGAVALLMLAGALILLLVAWSIFDTGRAAQDKMAVQISADSAAYSHSVIKARSMNVITYANTIKRMYYSYLSTYTNGWVAMIAAEALAVSKCKPPPLIIFTLCECATAIEMGLLILFEGLEALVTNEPTLGVLYGDYVPLELNGLERYTKYMHKITPWWAYIEGFSRAATNGGMMSAQWPPPPTSITNIKIALGNIGNLIQTVTGFDILGQFPGFTKHVDSLPIARRDHMNVWEQKFSPYEYKVTVDAGTHLAGAEYCVAYLASFEHILHGVQTYTESHDPYFSCPQDYRNIFVGLDIVPAVGCLTAHLSYDDDGYLDYRIHQQFSGAVLGIGSNDGKKMKWNKATGTMAIAYRPRAGRNDDNASRQKYGIPPSDHVRSDDFTNEGFFALARSEIFFRKYFDSFTFPLGGVLNGISAKLGIQAPPDMWSPRWKARNRPFALAGEEFGSVINADPAGLNDMVNDMGPLLLLGSVMGAVDDHFSIESAYRDLRYLLRVDSGFQEDELNGISK